MYYNNNTITLQVDNVCRHYVAIMQLVADKAFIMLRLSVSKRSLANGITLKCVESVVAIH